MGLAEIQLQDEFGLNQSVQTWTQGMRDVDEHDPQQFQHMYEDTLGMADSGIDKLAKQATKIGKDVLSVRDKATVYKVTMPDDLADINKTVHTIRVISVVRGILQAYITASNGVSFRSNLTEIVSPLMKMYKVLIDGAVTPSRGVVQAGLEHGVARAHLSPRALRMGWNQGEATRPLRCSEVDGNCAPRNSI